VVLADNVSSFEHSRKCTTTTSDGRRETENLTPSYLGPLAISDRPPRPTGNLRQDVLPSSDEVAPEPPTYYVPRDADPGFEHIHMGDEPRVFCEAEIKRQETRRKNSKKGSKEEKPGRKRGQDEVEDEEDVDWHEQDHDEVVAPPAPKKGKKAAPVSMEVPAKKRAPAREEEKENIAPGPRRSARNKSAGPTMDLDR
jgi:hypothetical protein